MRFSADNLDMQPPPAMLNTQRFAAGRLGSAASRPRVPIGRAGQTALEFAKTWTAKRSGIGLQAWKFFERFFRRGRSGRVRPHLEKQWIVRRRPAFSRFATSFPAALRDREATSTALPFPSRPHAAVPVREIVTRKTILSFVTQLLPLRLPPDVLQGRTRAAQSSVPAGAETNPWRDRAPLPGSLTLSRPPVPQASWLGASPSAPPPVQLLPTPPAAAGRSSAMSPNPFAAPLGTLPRPLFTLLPELIYGVRTFAAPAIPRGSEMPHGSAIPDSSAVPSGPSIASGFGIAGSFGQERPPAAGPVEALVPRSSHSKPVTQLLAVTAALALLQSLPIQTRPLQASSLQALSNQGTAQAAPLAGRPAALAALLPRRAVTLRQRVEQPLTRQATRQIPDRGGVERAGFRSLFRPSFSPELFSPEARPSPNPSRSSLPHSPVPGTAQEAAGARWLPSALRALIMPHLFTQRNREQQADASTRPLPIAASMPAVASMTTVALVTAAASKMSVLLSRHSPEVETDTRTGPSLSTKAGNRPLEVPDFSPEKNAARSFVIFREPQAAPTIPTRAIVTRSQQAPVSSLFAQAGEKDRRTLPEIRRSQSILSNHVLSAGPAEAAREVTAAREEAQRFSQATAPQRLSWPLTFLLTAGRPKLQSAAQPSAEAFTTENVWKTSLNRLLARVLPSPPASSSGGAGEEVPAAVPGLRPVPPLLGVRGRVNDVFGGVSGVNASDTTRLVEETLNTEFQPQLLSLVQGFLSSWRNTVVPDTDQRFYAEDPLPAAGSFSATIPMLTPMHRGATARPELAASPRSTFFPDRSRLTMPGHIQTRLHSQAGQELPIPRRIPQSAIFLETPQDLRTRMTDSSLDLRSRSAANIGAMPFDRMLSPKSEAGSAGRSLLHLPLPMLFPESTADARTADAHMAEFRRTSPNARLLPAREKTAALPLPRPVSMTLPVSASLSAPEETWAIQRVASGGQSAAASTPQAAQQDTNLASQEKGAAANDVHLLANEVWSLLKRRLETEAERIGRR